MRKAFIIGLGQFADPSIPALPSAEKDAAALRAILTDPIAGGVDPAQAQILLSPTREVLRAALSTFLVAMVEGDEFVLFLAGHAYPQASGRLVFPCRDSRADRLSATAFTERDLQLLIAERPGLRGILVLDTCFAGSFGQVKSTLKARGEQPLVPPPPEDSAIAIVYSARARELAYESSDSGLFTGLLVEGLRAGAGCPETQEHVTAADIVDWVKAKMRQAKISEQFWPGLREGRAVTGLALSKNPRFSIDARLVDAAEVRAERTLARIVKRLTGAEGGDAKLRELAELVGGNQPLPADEAVEIIRVTKRKVATGWLKAIATATIIAFLFYSQNDANSGFMAALIVGLVLAIPAFVQTFWHDEGRNFLLFTLDGFVLSKSCGDDQKIDVYLWPEVTAVRVESIVNGGYTSSKLVIETHGGGERPPLRIDDSTYPLKTYELQETFLRWLHMRMSVMPAPQTGPLQLAEVDAQAPFQRVAKAAALVGVWAYAHLPRLSAPEHDLTRLHAVLGECGIAVATSANPDLAAFESWLGDNVHAAAGQILVMVFSGHGILAGNELMLALPGTRPDRLAETAFPIAKIADIAVDARVRHLVLVLDCCMSGASGSALGLAEVNLSQLFEADRALITVLAGAARDQEAYALQGEPSFFTAAIADAIEHCLAAKRQTSLVAISDEAAQRLKDVGLGQRHWRFASDAANAIALTPPPEIPDRVAEQHASVEEKQRTALRSIWETAAKAGVPGNLLSFKRPSVGRVFRREPRRTHALPLGCTVPLAGIAILVALANLLSGTYGALMWAVPIAAGLILLIRGSHQPRSLLIVSVYGVVKDGVLYPGVNIASTQVSSSSFKIDNGSETIMQEWQLYGHDGKKIILAQSDEPWGDSIEDMQSVAQKYLAKGKVEALNDLLSVQLQRG